MDEPLHRLCRGHERGAGLAQLHGRLDGREKAPVAHGGEAPALPLREGLPRLARPVRRDRGVHGDPARRRDLERERAGRRRQRLRADDGLPIK